MKYKCSICLFEISQRSDMSWEHCNDGTPKCQNSYPERKYEGPDYEATASSRDRHGSGHMTGLGCWKVFPCGRRK